QTLLVRASHQAPIVLVLDDLHCADQNSLLLLEVIAQELRGHRILVVGTCRDEEIRPQLAQTMGELSRTGVIRVALRGLSPAETGQLMAGVSGREPIPDTVERVHTRTGG